MNHYPIFLVWKEVFYFLAAFAVGDGRCGKGEDGKQGFGVHGLSFGRGNVPDCMRDAFYGYTLNASDRRNTVQGFVRIAIYCRNELPALSFPATKWIALPSASATTRKPP